MFELDALHHKLDSSLLTWGKDDVAPCVDECFHVHRVFQVRTNVQTRKHNKACVKLIYSDILLKRRVELFWSQIFLSDYYFFSFLWKKKCEVSRQRDFPDAEVCVCPVELQWTVILAIIFWIFWLVRSALCLSASQKYFQKMSHTKPLNTKHICLCFLLFLREKSKNDESITFAFLPDLPNETGFTNL